MVLWGEYRVFTQARCVMCVLTGSVAGGITVGSLNMVHEFLSNFEAISSTNVIWQDM